MERIVGSESGRLMRVSEVREGSCEWWVEERILQGEEDEGELV
ncbi:hypothetical protein COLO4_08490 [Corchorus olitorius]|uniref:Uncharacterized protein n=1 Tax=Corchorus olitorius TaxID=93759 RepID=A0A1R3KFM1_9ROSI|nr:hypothetical protein COLO4_08490 [Corchorus olitorius]